MEHLLQLLGAPPADAASDAALDAERLAHACWLGVQLAPELCGGWRTSPFVRLLSHWSPHARWAAAQALSRLLAMVSVRHGTPFARAQEGTHTRQPARTPTSTRTHTHTAGAPTHARAQQPPSARPTRTRQVPLTGLPRVLLVLCLRRAQSCVARTQLLDQALTPPQLIECVAAWHAARAAAQTEAAAMWLPPAALPPPASLPHLPPSTAEQRQDTAAAAMDEDGAPATSDAAAAPRGRKRRMEHRGGAHAVPAAGHAPQDQQPPQQPAQPALPPARLFVDVCGVQLPRRAAAAASSSARASSSLLSSASAAASGQPGKLLQRGAAAPAAAPPFVATPTAEGNLRAAAWALCCGRPLLLEGPPGCGKTSLLEELARRTDNAAEMVRAALVTPDLRCSDVAPPLDQCKRLAWTAIGVNG